MGPCLSRIFEMGVGDKEFVVWAPNKKEAVLKQNFKAAFIFYGVPYVTKNFTCLQITINV